MTLLSIYAEKAHVCIIALRPKTQGSLRLCRWLTRAAIMIDKLKYLLVPHQLIGWILYDVALIREVKQLAWHAVLLEQIEKHDALALRQTIIQRVVDNNLRCCPILNV